MRPTPQGFASLALIYLVTNARVGSGDRRRRVQRVMTRPERESVTAILERLPATVRAWSDGLATLEPMHIVEVRRQLTTLSSSGPDQWWAGPRDCREELMELADAPRYDSVIVLWPSPTDLALCGWGCTVGPSEATFGAGFTSIASASGPSPDSTTRGAGPDPEPEPTTRGAGPGPDSTTNHGPGPDPEQGYVHEWLHQVEAIYRALGVGEDELPSLHDAGDFTSTRPAYEPPFGRSYAEYHDGGPDRPPARTWAPWYRDWMTGRLRRMAANDDADGTPLGLTPERWSRRTT